MWETLETIKKEVVCMRKKVAIIIALILALSFAGCVEPDKLVSGKSVKRPEAVDIAEQNDKVTDFAVRLLQNTFTGEENLFLSPVSVLSGLSLIANGTEGESLAQIEEVVGMSAKEMNEYIYSYNNRLSELSGENCEASLINSLWINEKKDVVVSDEFLYENEMYGNASVYSVPFGKNCASKMDQWISESTQDIVEDILYDAPKDATMCFVSSFVFSGVWETGFDKCGNSKFGTVSENTDFVVNQLFGREDYYIEDNNASGFVKFFKQNKYAFVVMLPNENVDIHTYIEGLTSEKINNLIRTPKKVEVDIYIPEISSSYELNMNHILTEMGIRDIWNCQTADFSGFGYVGNGENIQMEQLIYKTDITLNSNGINTDVEAEMMGMIAEYETRYRLEIERPFVVFLIDYENNVPLLIGVVMNV